MKLIAQKPCTFAGKKFYIGDEIPAEYVLNPKAQERMGVIVCTHDAPDPEPQEAANTVTVIIHADEGDTPIDVTPEGIQNIFDVLTSNAEDGKVLVEQMTDNMALLLLNITDGRKTIKEAAKERAKAIVPEEPLEEEGEQ